MPKNRFANLFGLASELDIDHEMLRVMAHGHTGEYSLKSLNPQHIRDIEQSLRSQKENNRRAKIEMLIAEFINHRLSDQKVRILCELIADVFPDLPRFLAWLERDYKIRRTEWITPEMAGKIIAALTIMRRRGYKIRSKEV